MIGERVTRGRDSAVNHAAAHPGEETVTVSIPVGGFNLSGGIKVLVILANAMAARGWRVAFLAPDYASTSPFVLNPSVVVVQVSTGPEKLPLIFRKFFYYIKLSGIASRGVKLCLANYYLTAYCGVASRFLVNRAATVVWYVQGYEAVSHGLIAEANALSRMARFVAAKLSYRLPVRIISVSDWVRARIGRPDSLVVHAPALDFDVFQPLERRRTDSSAVVGTIGRVGETKGYRYFLEAVGLLPDPSRIRVLVASPTRDEVPLPSGVSAESVHAQTELAMARFYNRCDVFVLPSLMEGFPLPPLEAMACGCAVVTTACGGVKDYARDGVNCLVVPPADSRALARAVWRLCQEPDLRGRLSEEGIKTARNFQRDRIVSEFVDTIGRLLVAA